jgi:hypothetical protein
LPNGKIHKKSKHIDIVGISVAIARLRLRITSHTGNADSLSRIATACRWGFHKYSGIAHFVEERIFRIGIAGSRFTAEGPQPPPLGSRD